MVLRSLCTRILNINLGKFTIQSMILTFLIIYNFPLNHIINGWSPQINVAYVNIAAQPLDQLSSKYKSAFIVLIIIIVLSFTVGYFERRNEIYSDEFAIKCGYGDALLNAIRKLHEHNYSLNPFKISKLKMNIIDKILRFLNAIFLQLINVLGIFKLSSYPDYKTRERLIQKKIDAYDTSKNNINRTYHIQLDPTADNLIDNF